MEKLAENGSLIPNRTGIRSLGNFCSIHLSYEAVVAKVGVEPTFSFPIMRILLRRQSQYKAILPISIG